MSNPNVIVFQFVNMFDQSGSSEWLLYISEWQSPHNNMPISNIRVTTKVRATALGPRHTGLRLGLGRRLSGRGGSRVTGTSLVL